MQGEGREEGEEEGDRYRLRPGVVPDGKRIVFSLRFRPAGRVDIYTARSDGTHLTQITDTRKFETFSDWGPHRAAP